MGIAKIAIIGAGNVGGASAAAIAARRLGAVYLYDIVEGLAAGKAMDVNQASPFFHSDSRVVGCDSVDELADSDIVIITAGAPRRIGMARRDLLRENLSVLVSLASDIMELSPAAKILVVTNPVEPMTWHLRKQWPQMNVFGLGCSLDTLRFRFFLAEEADTSVDAISGLVIGTHDDNMIPLVEHATIGGVGITHLLSSEQIDRVVRRTREAGTSIVRRLKTRGSFYAASHTVAEIVEAIVRHTCGVFPLTVYCAGQYGYRDVCLNLPAVVGAGGVERLVEIDLDEDERQALDVCVRSMAELVGTISVSREA